MWNSDFILTNRTCAIAITADMSFRTALAADFNREYENIEFLWKQRPGIGGVAALPPAASQIPGNYLCFLVTRATEKWHLDPENLGPALNLDSSTKPAATATWDITTDTGEHLGQSAPKFEDLLDHYGDGFWRCNDISWFG